MLILASKWVYIVLFGVKKNDIGIERREMAPFQDRYPATAVETGEYLKRRMVYIDLNMVRTGMINHLSQWKWSGYNEIQKPRRKNILIAKWQGKWLVLNIWVYFNPRIKSGWMIRWKIMGAIVKVIGRKSVAIGSNAFIKKTFSHLGAQAKGLRIIEAGDAFQIREKIESITPFLAPKSAI